MKILLTGASSFTGFWFAKKLSEAGHEVVAPLRNKFNFDAECIRSKRIVGLRGYVEIVEECAFGDDKFIELIASKDFELLCHHAAHVDNYRSPDFDVGYAINKNTNNLRHVLRVMHGNGLRGVLLTGSVFEANRGAGNMPLKAFSPYGLSKGLTADIFEYYCSELNLRMGQFTIPNPFGPLEEPRFCNYLMNTWAKGEVASVNTPAYIRDNIHISLLAVAYKIFAENFYNCNSNAKINPSGYVESQGAFTIRFAAEMRARLQINAEVKLLNQTDYSEPYMRVNTDCASSYVGKWNERLLWDELAEYYSRLYKIKHS